MQGADLIFCFRDKDFRFWKPDGPYNAVISSQPYFFQFAPTGWQEFSIENIINDKYWSIDRKVTAPATYVEDAGQILKNIFYKMGTKEEVFLVMAQQQLNYTAPPTAKFNFTAGGTNLIDGNNTGTITGTPGDQVNIKLVLNTDDITDSITGTIGAGINTSNLDIIKTFSPYNVVKNIPASGSIPFDVVFNNTTSTASATMNIVDAKGGLNGSYGYWYKKVYTGQVDGSTFVHDGNYVTATTLEDGLIKFLKANENTTLEIPVSDADAITVKMDGVTLHSTGTFITSNLETYSAAVNNSAFTFFGLYTITYFNTVAENSGTNLVYNNITGAYIPGLDYATSDQNFLEATGNVHLTVNIKDYPLHLESDILTATGYAGSAKVYIKNQAGVLIRELYSHSFTSAFSLDVVLNDTFDIDLVAGDKLFFIVETNLSKDPFDGHTEFFNLFVYPGNSEHTYDSETRNETTYIKAFTLQSIFNRLIPYMTENTYIAMDSAYLNAMKQIVLTCGNAIRGLSDAKMKINFTNLFQFLDSIDCVGIREYKIGVKKYIDIARKESLIDNSVWIDLPEPAYRPKMSFAKKLFFNRLNIGYPELSTDVGALNGNEEFNCGYEFSTPATLTPATIEKISKDVKASCYEIEKIRITTFRKDTTDYKSDNQLYALCIEENPTAEPVVNYALDRSLNASATGLIDTETVFNIPISPKRNVNRNGSYLRSCSYRCDEVNLIYRTADKNNKLVADGVIEKADVNIGSLDDIFFYPIVIDAEFNVPFDWIEQLDENPRKVIRFPFMGIYWKTVLVKSNFTPSSGAAQSFQLMFTKENDINKLIQYFG